MLTRRAFVAGALATPLAAPSTLRAQQKRIPRIALLSLNPPGDFRHQATLEGLRALGYIDGQSIAIEYFWAQRADQVDGMAARAVASKPDLILAHATPPTQAAIRATATIPIVTAATADILGAGIVQSLARPGGNVTGLTQMSTDIAAKRLQMLQQMVPGLARVAALYNPDNSGGQLSLAQIEAAGPILKIDVRRVPLRGTDELSSVFAKLKTEGVQALILVQDTTYNNNPARIGQAASASRLPIMAESKELAQGGALIAYGLNLADHYRRSAYYVDRILKGAKPQDLPVEQPMLFDFIINRKTADALRLEIPLGLWVQATEIIE